MKIYAYRNGELNQASMVKTGAEKPAYVIDFTDAMPLTTGFTTTVTTALDSGGNTQTSNCVGSTSNSGTQASVFLLTCGTGGTAPSATGSRFKLTTTATLSNSAVCTYEVYVLTVDPAYGPIPT